MMVKNVREHNNNLAWGETYPRILHIQGQHLGSVNQPTNHQLTTHRPKFALAGGGPTTPTPSRRICTGHPPVDSTYKHGATPKVWCPSNGKRSEQQSAVWNKSFGVHATPLCLWVLEVGESVVNQCCRAILALHDQSKQFFLLSTHNPIPQSFHSVSVMPKSHSIWCKKSPHPSRDPPCSYWGSGCWFVFLVLGLIVSFEC